jgi:hypothetical protein
MEYIKEGFTLPVPLNLIPTPLSTYYSFKDWLEKRKDDKEKARQESVSNINEEPPSIIELRSNVSGNHYYNNNVSGTLKLSESTVKVLVFLCFFTSIIF